MWSSTSARILSSPKVVVKAFPDFLVLGAFSHRPASCICRISLNRLKIIGIWPRQERPAAEAGQGLRLGCDRGQGRPETCMSSGGVPERMSSPEFAVADLRLLLSHPIAALERVEYQCALSLDALLNPETGQRSGSFLKKLPPRARLHCPFALAQFYVDTPWLSRVRMQAIILRGKTTSIPFPFASTPIPRSAGYRIFILGSTFGR